MKKEKNSKLNKKIKNIFNKSINISKKTLLVVLGVVIGASVSVYATSSWRNTYEIGRDIADNKVPDKDTLKEIRDNLDYLKNRNPVSYLSQYTKTTSVTGINYQRSVSYCPSGYVRTGCSGEINRTCWGSTQCDYMGAYPYGSGCQARGNLGTTRGWVWSHIYCTKVNVYLW